MTALKEKGKEIDPAYGAALSVAKASREKRASFNIKKLAYKHLLSMVFPIILIDSPLFEACLDSKDQLKVSSLNWGRFFLKNSEAGNAHSLIDIVTIDYLSDYLEKVEKEFKTLIKAGKENSKFLKIENISMREAVGNIISRFSHK